MIDGALTLQTAGGMKRVALSDYLEPAAREAAITDANAWIKGLRHAQVDGQPMRRRFRYRGDSLWWFTELYLHKRETIATIFRTILALQTLVERERPLGIEVASGGRLLHGLAPQIARAHGIRCRAAGFGTGRLALARLRWRARALTFAAHASRLKHRRQPVERTAPIAAFVHRAFWTAGRSDGSAESYIGPVLAALERRVPGGGVAYVGVGPTENFAARRWWRAAAGGAAHGSVMPVEAFAPLDALRGSRRLWRARHALLRALWSSHAVRQAAVIRGCDCWPIIREELAGVVLLQWPWSARAMDEAAAALDAIRPKVAVTYAEAGGWGRALMLECRRRGIASVGLQHGFIYRHWLNYRHEPDEMEPDPALPNDAGFPRPSVTLVFDAYAARHLEEAGRFPSTAVAVTGSARLDALIASAKQVSVVDVEKIRMDITGATDGTFLLVVTKFREARRILRSLIDGAGELPGVHVAIKTHPAETTDVYSAAAQGAPHVRVLPAAAPLAALLRAARAVVTVNSTVALDAIALGIPALIIDLPNNLSPFVDLGVMAGAARAEEIAPQLRRILYDREFSQQLSQAREIFLQRFEIRPDGRAADRGAEAVLRFMED